ncbi:MAG: hypothetical protein K0Q47_157 [Sedimentibacter sp.]|jgi:phage protein D|nr:hypothetical protein [Sedimentibacter sp.]
MPIPEAYDPFFYIKVDGKSLNSKLATKISKFEFEEIDDKTDILTFIVDNQSLEFTDEDALDVGGTVTFQFGYLNRRGKIRKGIIKNYEGFEEIKIEVYQTKVGSADPAKPTTKTAPSKVTSTQSSPKKYTVIKGDNLSSIAKKFGLSKWQDLYEVNKSIIGKNPNLVYPGQKLTIPGTEEKVSSATKKTTTSKSTNVSSNTSKSSPAVKTSNPLAQKSRVWKKKTYSEIAKSIATEMGLLADIQTTKIKYDSVPQTNEDNIEFLRRLAKKIGYTVNIYGDYLFFRKQDYSSKTQRTLVYFIDGAGEVEKFSPSIKTSGSTSAASSSTVDPASKSEVSSKSNGTKDTHLGKYSYVVDGITGEEKRVLTPESSASNDSVKTNTDSDTSTSTNSKMSSSEKKWQEAEITCVGIPEIEAGKLVTIKGVGKRWSGNWYVKTVRHTLDSDGYRTVLECTRDASGKAAKISEEVDGAVNDTPAKTDSSKKAAKVVIVDGITGKETVGEMP